MSIYRISKESPIHSSSVVKILIAPPIEWSSVIRLQKRPLQASKMPSYRMVIIHRGSKAPPIALSSLKSAPYRFIFSRQASKAPPIEWSSVIRLQKRPLQASKAPPIALSSLKNAPYIVSSSVVELPKRPLLSDQSLSFAGRGSLFR